LDISAGSRAEDNGPQENPRRPNCQEVEADRRRHAPKSVQYGIVTRRALTTRSLRIFLQRSPASRGAFFQWLFVHQRMTRIRRQLASFLYSRSLASAPTIFDDRSQFAPSSSNRQLNKVFYSYCLSDGDRQRDGAGLQSSQILTKFCWHNGAIIARVNVAEDARRLAAAWNAFLDAETTAIENVAVRRIRRAYRKKHPCWREAWDRVLRAEYVAKACACSPRSPSLLLRRQSRGACSSLRIAPNHGQ
jgi:hypothetical protein